MILQGIAEMNLMKAFAQSSEAMDERDFIEKFTSLVSLKIKDKQEFTAEKVKNGAEKYVERAKSDGIGLDSIYLFSCLSEFVQENVTLFK